MIVKIFYKNKKNDCQCIPGKSLPESWLIYMKSFINIGLMLEG